MYRGSSGLLQKNHRIHTGAIAILRSEEYQKLVCGDTIQIERGAIPLIMKVKRDLSKHYTDVTYTRNEMPLKVSDTDTLLSKILLGTFGRVPAYDRYFINGLKVAGFRNRKFTEGSLHELFDFITFNQSVIDQLTNQYNSPNGTHYPIMKVLDMYFWQMGFDTETSSKKKEKRILS